MRINFLVCNNNSGFSWGRRLAQILLTTSLIASAAFVSSAEAQSLKSSSAKSPPAQQQMLHMINTTVNGQHVTGDRMPNDPDGVWDDDNSAFLKYRALRDAMMWRPDHLALAIARQGRETPELVVLARVDDRWMVLVHDDEEVLSLEERQRQGWRIETQPYEPAPSPSAPWVMAPRMMNASIAGLP